MKTHTSEEMKTNEMKRSFYTWDFSKDNTINEIFYKTPIIEIYMEFFWEVLEHCKRFLVLIEGSEILGQTLRFKLSKKKLYL